MIIVDIVIVNMSNWHYKCGLHITNIIYLGYITTVGLKSSFTIKVAKNVSNVSYFVIFRFLDPLSI